MKTILRFLPLWAVLALPGLAMAFSVGISPVNQTINQTDMAVVDINLNLTGGEALYGFDFDLLFDPAILAFDSFSTTLMDPDDPFNPLFDYVGGFTYESSVDPTVVSFDGFFLPWDFMTEPLTGTITLASLTFMGIAPGTSPLSLTGELDLGNLALDRASSSGSVTVAPVPEPSTFLLLGLGLAGLVGYRRRMHKG